MKGWAQLHPWRMCFIPNVNSLWESSCPARLAACSPLSKPKAERSLSLLGPGSQRREQEKRCSRCPQHHRGRQGCSASGPCLPGDRAAAAPASVHPTPPRESELLPPSLLTLPSFPTPSSSALSPSVIKRIEGRWAHRSCPFSCSHSQSELQHKIPAHPSAPGCNKLSYSPSISVTTANLPPPPHTEKTTSKSSWRHLCQGKKCSWTWRIFSEENQT